MSSLNISESDGVGPLFSPIMNGSSPSYSNLRNIGSPKTVLVPLKYSLSEGLSPKEKPHGIVNNLNQSTGPLLTSTQMSLNLSTYLDSKSGGLSSRLVQYNKAQEPRFTHQAKYSSPGVFPVVHLRKRELPTICISPKKVTVRIAGPELPISHQSLLEDSPRLFSPNASKSAASDLSTRSVLDALKEISRKRIQTQDLEYNSSNVKKPRISSNLETVFNQTSPEQQKSRPAFVIDPVSASLTSSSSVFGNLTLKRKIHNLDGLKQVKKTIAQTQTDSIPETTEVESNDNEAVLNDSILESTPKKMPRLDLFNFEASKKNKLAVLLRTFNGDKKDKKKPVSILSPPNKPKHNKHVSFSIPDKTKNVVESLKDDISTSTTVTTSVAFSGLPATITTTSNLEPPTPAPSPEPQPTVQNFFPSVSTSIVTTTTSSQTSQGIDTPSSLNPLTFTTPVGTPNKDKPESLPKVGGFKFDMSTPTSIVQAKPVESGTSSKESKCETSTPFQFGQQKTISIPTTPTTAFTTSGLEAIKPPIFSSTMQFPTPKLTPVSSPKTPQIISNTITPVSTPAINATTPNGFSTPVLLTSTALNNNKITTGLTESGSGFQFGVTSKEFSSPATTTQNQFSVKTPDFGNSLTTNFNTTSTLQVGGISSANTNPGNAVTNTSQNVFGMSSKKLPVTTTAKNHFDNLPSVNFSTSVNQFDSLTSKSGVAGTPSTQFNGTTTASTLPQFSTGTNNSLLFGVNTTKTNNLFSSTFTSTAPTTVATTNSGIFAPPTLAPSGFKSTDLKSKAQFGTVTSAPTNLFGANTPTISNIFGSTNVTTANTGFGTFQSPTPNRDEKPTFGSGFGLPTTTASLGFNSASSFGNSDNSKAPFAFGAATTTVSSTSGFALSKSPALGFNPGNATTNSFGTTPLPFGSFSTTTTTAAFNPPSNSTVTATPNLFSSPGTAPTPGFGGSGGDSISKSTPVVFGSGSGFGSNQQTPQQATSFGSFATPRQNDTFTFGASGATPSTNKPGMFTFGASASKEPGQSNFQFNSNPAPAFGQTSAPTATPTFGTGNPPMMFGTQKPAESFGTFGSTAAAPSTSAFTQNSAFVPPFNPPFNSGAVPTGMFSIGSGTSNPKQRTQIKARRRT